jgi:hypothetical protein
VSAGKVVALGSPDPIELTSFTRNAILMLTTSATARRKRREALRRSWAIGEMIIAHPELTGGQAIQLYERVAWRMRAEMRAGIAAAGGAATIVRLRPKRDGAKPRQARPADRLALGLALSGIGLAGCCVAAVALQFGA